MKSINYEELFVKPFDEIQAIDKILIDLIDKGDSRGIIDYLHFIECNYFYIDDYNILLSIAYFTLKDADLTKIDEYLDSIRNQSDVHLAKIVNEGIPKIFIERDDVNIEVSPLSLVFPGSLEKCPDLETIDRVGTCFDKVNDISLTLDFNVKIVTGYIYLLTDKSRHLHSWLEATINGEEVVIDGIFNAVFNKDGYYALMKPEVYEVMDTKEHAESVIKYFMALNGCVDGIPQQAYYFFHHELVDDFKKNNELFKEYFDKNIKKRK